MLCHSGWRRILVETAAIGAEKHNLDYNKSLAILLLSEFINSGIIILSTYHREEIMHFSKNHPSLSFRTLRALAVLILPFVLAALACSFQTGGDQTLRETDIAIGIQQTLIAQTATALESALSATLPPVVETALPEPTQPPPTAVEVATQPPLPTDTPTVAVTPTTPVADVIPIVDWKMQFWAPINSGCLNKEALCWKMDDNYNKHLGAADLILASKTPLFVDPSWPNPYLTFSHKYNFERVARVDLQVDGRYITVKNLSDTTSGGRWVNEAINLKDYIGKNIIVSFVAQGIWGSGGIKGSDWLMNDVNIVPNYEP